MSTQSNVEPNTIYKAQKALKMISKLTIYDSSQTRNRGLGQGGSAQMDQIWARMVGKGPGLGPKHTFWDAPPKRGPKSLFWSPSTKVLKGKL